MYKKTISVVVAISLIAAIFPFPISASQGKTNAEEKRIEYKNGDYYEGELKKGKPHGEGKYVWRSGAWYFGDFKKGVIHGSGIYTWPDGSSCNADWKKGKIEKIEFPELCTPLFPGRYTTGPVRRTSEAEELIAKGIWIALGVAAVKSLSSLSEHNVPDTPSQSRASCSYRTLKDHVSSNDRRRVRYQCVGKYPNTTGWLEQQNSGSWYALHPLGVGAFRGKTKEEALTEACGCS